MNSLGGTTPLIPGERYRLFALALAVAMRSVLRLAIAARTARFVSALAGLRWLRFRVSTCDRPDMPSAVACAKSSMLVISVRTCASCVPCALTVVSSAAICFSSATIFALASVSCVADWLLTVVWFADNSPSCFS